MISRLIFSLQCTLITLIILSSPYVFSAAGYHYGQNKGWTILEVNTLPEKREDCSFVESGNLFYLIGGRGIKPVEAFNPATNSWMKKNNTPLELHHCQAISFNHEIYIVGAMNGKYPHEQPVENIYIYNPQSDIWRKGAAMPPRRRGSGGTVVYKNKIYFVAGIQDGHYEGTVPWMDVFDPLTEKWDSLPNAPHARDHFHAVVIGNKLYLAGGRITSLKTKQSAELTIPEVDVYDFRKKQWNTLPVNKNLPTQRAGCTAVEYKGMLVVIGGESIASESSHHEVEAYDPKSGLWHSLPGLTTGRHDTQAVVFNNSIYIAAGSANRGGGPDQNTIEVLKDN